MLTNGDKLVVTKDVATFLKKGDVVKVVDADENGLISFAFGDEFMHKGLMTTTEFEEHFEKMAEKKPTVTKEMVDKIIIDSDIEVMTVFDKCTIVTCKLPNGFVIVESSACVSPENYDEETGIEICMRRIIDKIWELEGYKLQSALYEEFDCDDCCYEDDCGEDEDEDEEDDEDCGNCLEYDCPMNPNY